VAEQILRQSLVRMGMALRLQHTLLAGMYSISPAQKQNTFPTDMDLESCIMDERLFIPGMIGLAVTSFALGMILGMIVS
jgi:hypothetical protein